MRLSLGLLFAVFGVGSIGGALLVPWLESLFSRDRIYLACFAVCVWAMATLGWTRNIAVYPIALLLLGAAQSAIGVLTITLLQSRVTREMRGRVMSLQTLLNMGIRPLGDFPISLLIASVGAPATAGFSADVDLWIWSVLAWHAKEDLVAKRGVRGWASVRYTKFCFPQVDPSLPKVPSAKSTRASAFRITVCGGA